MRSASFGVTLLDFAEPALIGMFRAGPIVALARERSSRAGVLDAATLSAVFSLLRPNELVFNYVVNNYLLGKAPSRFDILAWNADGTNLPGRAAPSVPRHLRVRTCSSRPGAFEVLGTPVDLGRVSVETYVTGATTDHLTPWKGCYRTTQLMSGPSTFVLSNAGHIASLVNPPGNPKAHYFAGPEPGGDADDVAGRRRPGRPGRGGRTGQRGWASARARSARRRAGSAAAGIRSRATPPGTYVHG